jgi:hypothetical protein
MPYSHEIVTCQIADDIQFIDALFYQRWAEFNFRQFISFMAFSPGLSDGIYLSTSLHTNDKLFLKLLLISVYVSNICQSEILLMSPDHRNLSCGVFCQYDSFKITLSLLIANHSAFIKDCCNFT